MLNDRDQKRLNNIQAYCTKINNTLKRLNYNYEEFISDVDMQQSISFSIAQIGEIARSLSEDFTEKTEHLVPWHSIVGFRNVIIHEYNSEIFDLEVVWQTANKDIVNLSESIKRLLSTDL